MAATRGGVGGRSCGIRQAPAAEVGELRLWRSRFSGGERGWGKRGGRGRRFRLFALSAASRVRARLNEFGSDEV